MNPNDNYKVIFPDSYNEIAMSVLVTNIFSSFQLAHEELAQSP